MEVCSVKIEHAVKCNWTKWILLNKKWEDFLSLHVILVLKQGAHLIEYGMLGSRKSKFFTGAREFILSLNNENIIIQQLRVAFAQ